MGSIESLQILEEAKELLAQARASATLSESTYKKQIDKLSSEVKQLTAKVNAVPANDVDKEAAAADDNSLGEITGISANGGGRHPVFELLDKIVD
jgi:phage shock protein A